MFVRRIAVRHWRGLEDLALEDLSPGLNLVSGPNESGKSRLVQALWYGLFESSKGSAQNKKDLQSHGLGSEKPWVSVEFELSGEAWIVKKQFLGSGTNTELRGAGERHEGDAAEARLRELLRVAEPSSRGLKKEDAGIWPLLWVEQHESARTPTEEAGDEARHRLQDRLTAEVGEVAAGERGQVLLQRAREQRDRFYTAGRGDETGTLREARARLEACGAALVEARAARDGVAADADRLQTARSEEQGYGTRIVDAEGALKEARAKQEAARGARETLAAAERAEESAAGRLEQATQRRDARAAAEAQLAERAERVEALTAEQGTARAAVETATAVATERDAAGEAADRRTEAARAALDQLRRAERRSTARAQLLALRARLAEARAIRARISAAAEALAGIAAVTDEDVQALTALQEARAEARARLEGAAVRLTLEPERDLVVDGETLAASAPREWLVDDERTLEIEGVGRLRIEPGAGELAALRDAFRDAEAALGERLRGLGVEDVPAAREARDRRRDLERDLAGDRTALAREAPEGMDALTSAVREQELRLDLEAGAAPPEAPAPDADTTAAAEREDEAARTDLTETRQAREEAREALQSARTALATVEARLQSATQEQDAETARLAAMANAEALDTAHAEAVQALSVAGARTAEARAAFEALGGEGAADDVERLEKSVAQLREQQIRLGREISGLEERLRAAGEEGRHETVQEREAEFEQARAELERIEGQARAARRLYEVLDTAAREARERLAGPVVERIGPYLAELFPGTEVWLDESMNLQGLRAASAEARFDELSGGAKEQLALLVRIGLAEVLGAEEPWPLVLDDALVNTDPERIERLQRLLFQASKKMQILLFTCHGRLYDAVGADRRVELAGRGREGGGAI